MLKRYFGVASFAPLQVPPLLFSQIPRAWAGVLGSAFGSYNTWGLASCFTQFLPFPGIPTPWLHAAVGHPSTPPPPGNLP